MFKNFIIVVLLGTIVSYIYISVNERQKERLLKIRTPKMRTINRDEFEQALFELHEHRMRAEQEKNNVVPLQPYKYQQNNYQPNIYRTENPAAQRDNIESLKNAPSTEAQPVQEYPSYPDDQQQAAVPNDGQDQGYYQPQPIPMRYRTTRQPYYRYYRGQQGDEGDQYPQQQQQPEATQDPYAQEPYQAQPQPQQQEVPR